MMELYIVDAFTDAPFGGNPAGVCILEQGMDDETMLNIAREVNHSETAFVLKRGGLYGLRWFTPKSEVPLCGHATMAAAHVLWERRLESGKSEIRFSTKESGVLTVRRMDGMIVMDFPQKFVAPAENNDLLRKGLNAEPIFIGCDDIRYLLEMAHEDVVRNLKPDFEAMKRLGKRVVVTAQSSHGAYDFVSRVFAPSVGVDEVPVTGSAHCYLAPYWGRKLNKTVLVGYQASYRPGTVLCELTDRMRVLLKGKAKTVFRGELFI